MAKIDYKVGQRHSKLDQEHLDTALSHMLDAGANMPIPPATPDSQRVAEANAETAAMNKSIKASSDSQDYLIVGDPKQDTTWHLQVSNGGKLDHTLMGAAWAALHGGYRGNKYEGPDKQIAIDKLTALYEREKMDTPSKSIQYHGTKSVNLTELIEEVNDAWHDQFEPPEGMMPMSMQSNPCIVTVYDDHVIVCTNEGDYYSVAYTADAQGAYTFVPQEQWQEVEISYIPARETGESATMSVAKDSLVFHGGTLKALGGGKFGGYLVVFGDAQHTDLTGDFFTKDTDFGDHVTTPIYYHHGLDTTLKARVLDNAATLKKDNIGVWVEGQIKLRDEYEAYIYRQIEFGKEGLSSGTAAHLVEREPMGKAFHIKRWPLGLDASITPTPAEPRTMVVPLKSLSVNAELKALLEVAGDATIAGEGDGTSQSISGVNIMSDEYKELLAAVKETTDAVKALATKPNAAVVESSGGFDTIKAHDVQKTAYKAMLKDQNGLAIPGSGGFGDFLDDVRKADRKSNPIVSDRLRIMNDERYKELKANGSNETVPSEGGWLTQVDHENEFLRLQYESAVLSSKCNRRSLGAGFNGTTIYGRDETSRADGSRWGGVLGYHIGEGGTLTATKPQFRKIELKLKKIAVAVYATDEMLQDTNILEQEVMDSAPKELAFQVDNDVMNGGGVAGPLGYTNSAAAISVAAEAGQAAGTIVFQNIVKMWTRRWAPNSANYVWYINQDVEPQLFSMALSVGVGGVPVFLPPTGLSTQPYSTLFNRPVIPVEFCSTLGTIGDIQLVDLSQYKLIDKGGVQSASSIHVQFLTDETVFRFIYRVDGQPIWSKPLTPFKGSNTMSPFIQLASR